MKALVAKHKQKIRPDLYHCVVATTLPWRTNAAVNEVRLIHGTKPEHVCKILHGGMNERYSTSAAFGHGTYFADDAGKSDQYVMPDQSYNQRDPLHGLLGYHNDFPGTVYYCFVTRVMLGCSKRYNRGGVFATGRESELEAIPESDPATPFHSLVVRKEVSGFRYDEYVIFHSDLTYPEYLLAYERV
mmetsp:Transcript_17786/g.27487  ORF Transcript_17786/g.27487 Transcript_17786/m.27487 type:complete len:187 (-) Transcript_17786:560-1120(-)